MVAVLVILIAAEIDYESQSSREGVVSISGYNSDNAGLVSVHRSIYN